MFLRIIVPIFNIHISRIVSYYFQNKYIDVLNTSRV